MKIHNLKILPEYYAAVRNGTKRFEVRENDRQFELGDILRLMEWEEGAGFSGAEILVPVTYILYGSHYGVRDGYCVMSIGEEIQTTGG